MRSVLPLFLAFLIAAPLTVAHAQEADMQYFESFDGLERVVGRAWVGPVTTVTSTRAETIEINEQGTPVVISSTESTPAATPGPQGGIAMLSIFVHLFDSDEHAATGFERIDADLQDQQQRDPRAPMTDDLPLDGIGDQARGYMGDITSDNVTVTYTFATVQDGPFVYSITGMFGGVDAAELTGGYAESLVAAQMNRMAEQYDPEGASRGGLWSKLNAVEPEMPDGSTVTDLIVYPMDMATPQPSAFDPPMLDLDDPASIDGLATIDHASFTQPGGATPAADQAGVFRIDAWVLTFDSTEAAGDAVNPLATTLSEPFAITSGRGSAQSQADQATSTDIREGYISDRSLPPGNGIVSVLQHDEAVYAVVVYAIDENPEPVASRVMRVMTADSTISPDERLPVEGDEALGGLVPVDTAMPVATPEG